MLNLNYKTEKKESISELVEKLLNDDSYHIEFNGHLTNHAKHAVIALAGLNADDQKIKTFYNNHAEETAYGFGLEPPIPSQYKIDNGNWKEFLGQRTSFSSYFDFFNKEENEIGMDALLKKYLPALLKGWPGAFTHATIHVGWALAVKNRYMAIEGIAYMAYTYVDCNVQRLSTATISPDRSPIASILRIADYWGNRPEELKTWVADSQNEDYSEIARDMHPELKRSGLQFRIACMLGKGHPLMYETPEWMLDKNVSELWEELYYMVSILYLSDPGDFVLLHLITSLYAMENIAERLPEDLHIDVVKYYWVGVLGILFSKGDFLKKDKLNALEQLYNELLDPVDNDFIDQEWEKIIARAMEEEEEHNPKLVYVLKNVWESSARKAVYRDAAAQFTQTPQLPKSFEEQPLGEEEVVRYYQEIKDNVSFIDKNLFLLSQTNYLKYLHTKIRSKDASRADFRFYSKKIFNQLFEKGFELLPEIPTDIVTPIGQIYNGTKMPDNICGVSIMRAGESMESALVDAMCSIRIGKILIQRDKITKLPHLYYTALPKNIAECYVMLMDPMLATGGTALAAIQLLIDKGVSEGKIIFINLLTVTKGINAVHLKYPRVKIITSAIDSKLNNDAYMMPGIGDFGDRYFGTDI